LILALVVLTIAAVFVFRGRTASNASSVSEIRSIAVLPLKNFTGDPVQEYFTDGMTESLITELSKIDGLKVISRASAFTFKDKEVDARDVGKRLGVASVLEGSVRRNGDRVRVEVRLVSTEDGRVIWVGNSYDRGLGDIFAVQDEIGCSVAANLNVMLCGAGEAPKRYTDNVEAFQAYLKGRYFWNKRTGEGITKAIEYFDQAIAIDPKYALAYAGLADCYSLGVWYVPLEPKQATVNAKAAAAKALKLDETLSEAHNAMASVHALEWDWLDSKKESEKAIELYHGSAGAHHNYALFLNYTKRPDDAIREIKLAQELDPLSLVMNTDEGLGYYYAGRYDEAIAAYRKALDLDPNYVAAREYIGKAYAAKGMYTEALEEFQKAVRLSDRPDLLAYLGYIYAVTGKKAEAQKSLDELKRLSKQKYVPSYDMAVMFAALGQKDQAFRWLEKMYEEHSIYIVQVPVEPTLDALRSDPRFTDLLRRVGLSG
jgi:adenylate cyclase